MFTVKVSLYSCQEIYRRRLFSEFPSSRGGQSDNANFLENAVPVKSTKVTAGKSLTNMWSSNGGKLKDTLVSGVGVKDLSAAYFGARC